MDEAQRHEVERIVEERLEERFERGRRVRLAGGMVLAAIGLPLGLALGEPWVVILGLFGLVAGGFLLWCKS